MSKINSKILKHLTRLCINEVLDYPSDDTIGAPSPPAGGLGSGDQPALSQKTELTELRALLKTAVKEYLNSLGNDKSSMVGQDMGLNSPAMDDLSSFERDRIKRDLEQKRQKELKDKEKELSAIKKEIEFRDKQSDLLKKSQVPNLKHQIDQLKFSSVK